MVLLTHYFFNPFPLPCLPCYPLLKASKVEDPGHHCDFLSPLFCTSLQERNIALLLLEGHAPRTHRPHLDLLRN